MTCGTKLVLTAAFVSSTFLCGLWMVNGSLVVLTWSFSDLLIDHYQRLRNQKERVHRHMAFVAVSLTLW